LECFDDYITKNKEKVSNSCLKNCHGIYADVTREHIANNDTLSIKDETEEGFQKVFKEYQEYKKGFVKNYKNFFTKITKIEDQQWFMNVPFLNDLVQVNFTKCDYFGKNCMELIKKGTQNCNSWYKCTFKVTQMFKVVEVYLDTPTFDKITMDAKTNFVTQISVIGGTLGLFSGFSILSGFEIMYFIMKFLFGLFTARKERKL
jgi:hypothetical protein